MKENHPEIIEEIRALSADPEGLNALNTCRQSKTYEAYSKSLSDEDRLFMIIFSWNIRMGEVKENHSEGKAFELFSEFLTSVGI